MMQVGSLCRAWGSLPGACSRGAGAEYTSLFGVVDRANMVRRSSAEYRSGNALLGCSITLSSWIREALEARRILTLHPDCFRVRTPLEKAVYQIIRKYCGEQRKWSIGLGRLQAKTGSSSSGKEFRRQIRQIAARWDGQDFLGYRMVFGQDLLTAAYVDGPRRITADSQPEHRRITRRTLDRLCAERPDLDAGLMERAWRTWIVKKGERPRNAQAAFLGFCRRQPLSGKRTEPDPAGDSAPPFPPAAAWWATLTEEQRAAERKRLHLMEGSSSIHWFAPKP